MTIEYVLIKNQPSLELVVVDVEHELASNFMKSKTRGS